MLLKYREGAKMEEIKKEKIELSSLYPTIAEVLEKGGTFLLYPNGRSMLPTIRPGKDAVYLSTPSQLRKGEMILYRRQNGSFVLHRIVAIKEDGTYVLRGDNQYYDENGIFPSQIIAVVRRYTRDKKEIDCTSLSHRLYLCRRNLSYPFRKFCFRIASKLRRMRKSRK